LPTLRLWTVSVLKYFFTFLGIQGTYPLSDIQTNQRFTVAINAIAVQFSVSEHRFHLCAVILGYDRFELGLYLQGKHTLNLEGKIGYSHRFGES